MLISTTLTAHTRAHAKRSTSTACVSSRHAEFKMYMVSTYLENTVFSDKLCGTSRKKQHTYIQHASHRSAAGIVQIMRHNVNFLEYLAIVNFILDLGVTNGKTFA